ncbi:MAG: adenylate/guanylate cyclase domain-containing protein [Cyanobacteria bacterium]|nr:adenylate/guanylate cyclase domain-containing protein [Cyanobacteriota bacterium]
MSRGPIWSLALGLPLLLSPWLGGVDSQWSVLFFQLRGQRPAPADPVLLAVDADSLALDQLLTTAERRASSLWRRMGSWPWPRELQADLAVAVLERGARQVVFNIVMAGPSRYGPADDAAFQQRLAPWRQRVVLAASYGTSEQGQLQQAHLQMPLYSFPRVGLTALLLSPQGLVQAIPGRRWFEENLADFAPPHPAPLADVAAGRPTAEAPVGIDFTGPARRLPQVPAWQVLQQPPGFWRGRTVLIGATAPELGDQQETPFGPQSGAQVQAAALATVEQQRGFRAMPAPWSGLLLGGWPLLAGGLLRRGRDAGATAAIAVALAVVGVTTSGLGWALVQSLMPVTFLVATPLIGGGLRAWGQWRQESRERAYLHQILARKVSANLLRDILREPGPIWTQVGGSRARCVVLFTDLVEFTPMGADLQPSELFTLLNRYFEVIAAAVIAEDGLLDKFIGDALMAEFGVPRSRGDEVEALAAVRAALGMRASLAQLNVELVAAGRPPLRQGIGLHFGDVMAGNLGSSQRLEFTVIGLSVIVASRLEGLSRQFPDTPILISGDLLALLPNQLQVKPLGRHRLKGLPDPVDVYGLLDLI